MPPAGRSQPRMRLRPAVPFVFLLVLGAAFALGQSTLSSAAPPPPAITTASLSPALSAEPEIVETAVAPPAPAQAPRPRLHALAAVRGQIALHARPGAGPVAARVGPHTEFGSSRVLGVVRRRGSWLGVIAPELPDGRVAWVQRGHPGLGLSGTAYSLHADLSSRRLDLRRAGRLVHRLSVAVGRPGADTPTGRFAVTDKLAGAELSTYYGCCVLALSGHQPNPPQGWSGGNRLAIHGTNSPATIGAAASAGCLRGADADLQILMRRVPLGTPVFIRP